VGPQYRRYDQKAKKRYRQLRKERSSILSEEWFALHLTILTVWSSSMR